MKLAKYEDLFVQIEAVLIRLVPSSERHTMTRKKEARRPKFAKFCRRCLQNKIGNRRVDERTWRILNLPTAEIEEDSEWAVSNRFDKGDHR